MCSTHPRIQRIEFDIPSLKSLSLRGLPLLQSLVYLNQSQFKQLQRIQVSRSVRLRPSMNLKYTKKDERMELYGKIERYALGLDNALIDQLKANCIHEHSSTKLRITRHRVAIKQDVPVRNLLYEGALDYFARWEGNKLAIAFTPAYIIDEISKKGEEAVIDETLKECYDYSYGESYPYSFDWSETTVDYRPLFYRHGSKEPCMKFSLSEGAISYEEDEAETEQTS